MPAVTSGKILVTGASGFLAAWVIKELVDKGFSVLGTVRTPEKGEWLVKKFGDKVTYAIVKDVEHSEAFNEVVTDVVGICHMASPVTPTADPDPARFIEPAVNGTLSVLRAAKAYGKNVKRIVITGSGAAIIEPRNEPQTVYTEKDWNNTDPKLIEEGGPVSPAVSYRASKTIAERAAWKFMEDHKHEITFDLSVILPPFVFGPTIHDVKDIASINLTVGMFYKNLLTENPTPGVFIGNIIDARDVAWTHVQCFLQEVAGNERWVIGAGTFSWQDVYDGLGKLEKTPIPIPKGQPGSQKHPYPVVYGSEKAEKLLGMKPRDPITVFKDTLDSLAERGLIGTKA